MENIETAIKKVVEEEGQDKSLATALIAWFNELANGNEKISDQEITNRRIELLLEKTEVMHDLE